MYILLNFKIFLLGIELLIRVFCSCNIDTITPKMGKYNN